MQCEIRAIIGATKLPLAFSLARVVITNVLLSAIIFESVVYLQLCIQFLHLICIMLFYLEGLQCTSNDVNSEVSSNLAQRDLLPSKCASDCSRRSRIVIDLGPHFHIEGFAAGEPVQ